ncbi:MAG: peptidoglycan editing factor PgeF [Candidatus Neomarinimicrobiota bacterium]|nr:MAG: peptidoglycan editing factor PgeF [Candidatus Neomarinimicrobiota bacterium]
MKNGIEILHSSLLLPYNEICHGFSTRTGGVSIGKFESLNLGSTDGDSRKNIKENQGRFCRALGFSTDKLVQPVQVHSNNVAVVSEPGIILNTDALITNIEGIFLSVKTADCAPVILFDPVRKVVGAIHAGWKGIVKNIISKTINVMETIFNTKPYNILVAIGPAIHDCCYEVKSEVACEFDYSEVVERNGKLYLNSVLAIKNRLVKSGLLLDNINDIALCTSCNADKFFSYRRDKGQTGRLMTVIGLRKEKAV